MSRELLDTFGKWKSESENFRTYYVNRWAKNIQLTKGIFTPEELRRSKVRRRSKLFFRKIWATNWRLFASFYQAFLKDPNTFKVEGRDKFNDQIKAAILQNLMEWRRDHMMRHQSLFLKMIWAFQDIVNLGWSASKMIWEYDEALKKDGPKLVAYPPEQVYPDFTANTKEDMGYVIFENFMTKRDLLVRGFEESQVDKLEEAIPTENQLRSVRYQDEGDPLQNPGDNEYPRPGSYSMDRRNELQKKYIVDEIYYKDGKDIMLAIKGNNSETEVLLKEPKKNPLGNIFPVIFGVCLTEAHKLIGEGFPEPLEAPQESLNSTINMRKDNVALALSRMSIVSRFGNVDLQSLVNTRSGGIVMADDVNAVREIDQRDVTSSSYAETSVDEGMMSEMSGVTPGKQGLGKETKATVAQINFSESNAKIDLYIAIVGETYIREFYTMLAYMEQKFETNKTAFRVANDKLRAETGVPYLFDEVDMGFEADCIVNVGAGTVARQLEINQDLMAMNQAAQSNQSMIQLLAVLQKAGQPLPEMRLFNPTTFMEDLLPKLGKKNIDKYFLNLPAQPAAQQGGGGSGVNPGLAGGAQVQVNAPAAQLPDLSGLSG